jgi:hypothetical protein
MSGNIAKLSQACHQDVQIGHTGLDVIQAPRTFSTRIVVVVTDLHGAVPTKRVAQ